MSVVEARREEKKEKKLRSWLVRREDKLVTSIGSILLFSSILSSEICEESDFFSEIQIIAKHTLRTTYFVFQGQQSPWQTKAQTESNRMPRFYYFIETVIAR